MQFRTEIAPLKSCQGIVTHERPVLLVGSCFSDNIAEELLADRFQAVGNPFGPLYNPASIRQGLQILAEAPTLGEADIFEANGRWNSWQFHSRRSGTTPEEALERMNGAIAEGAKALREASTVILTFGSTRVFRHKGLGQVVANCHKVAAREFDERQLTLEEVIAEMRQAVGIIRSVNPSAHIILTVSPLRYLSAGAADNSVQKAKLLLGAAELAEETIYFPAFEIMMDDLRDYRFYADDMKHPSTQAVRYIYEIFSASFFTPETAALAAKGRALTKRQSHRPLSGGSQEKSE